MNDIIKSARQMRVFKFLIEPESAARPRFSGKIAYTPVKYRRYKQLLEVMVKRQLPAGWKPIKGLVTLEVEFELSRPKSVSQSKRPMPIVKPDIDNLLKAVMDAMNGRVWVDDCQITEVVASKIYAMNDPQINVLVGFVEE